MKGKRKQQRKKKTCAPQDPLSFLNYSSTRNTLMNFISSAQGQPPFAICPLLRTYLDIQTTWMSAPESHGLTLQKDLLDVAQRAYQDSPESSFYIHTWPSKDQCDAFHVSHHNFLIGPQRRPLVYCPLVVRLGATKTAIATLPRDEKCRFRNERRTMVMGRVEQHKAGSGTGAEGHPRRREETKKFPPEMRESARWPRPMHERRE